MTLSSESLQRQRAAGCGGALGASSLLFKMGSNAQANSLLPSGRGNSWLGLATNLS